MKPLEGEEETIHRPRARRVNSQFQVSCSFLSLKGDMEVTMELEEDVFFADLSKQISLLIMDDNEDDPTARCPPVSLQAFSHTSHPSVISPLLYEPNCGRESKGTGVFIPRSSLLRRKNRQARYRSVNSKSSKQPDKSKEAPQVTYRNGTSCDSFNSKKR